ncbi:MAG TPA: hypothetical protein VFM53_09395 [Anaeromyxobacteraceae bacterium]|nr:hypothetical protein [Anaeromyxobacteraceae bacterium]
MAERKPFLLRMDPRVLEALQRWADDDLRSLNGQIEYLLRGALRAAGRAPSPDAAPGPAPEGPASASPGPGSGPAPGG